MSTATNRPDDPDKPAPPLLTRVGNMTEDPELKVSKGGKSWTSLRIAVDTPKVAGQWSGERETVFYEVVAFDSIAVNVCESLRKGYRVIVHGTPEIRQYEAQDGTKQAVRRIVAQAIGAELRFARVTVTRSGRTAKPAVNVPEPPEPEAPAEAEQEDDPWATF